MMSAAKEERDLSDEDLLEAIRQGSGVALEELYNRHAGTIKRMVYQLIQDEERVQDIVQEIFTRIWTKGAAQFTPSNFQGWLYVLTRRVTIDSLRKETRRPQIVASDVENTLTNKGREGFQVEDADGVASKLDLMSALHHLAHDQQIVLKLVYFHGYTLSEVSGILHIPIGTVKTRLHVGLKRLRTSLMDGEGGDWIESRG